MINSLTIKKTRLTILLIIIFFATIAVSPTVAQAATTIFVADGAVSIVEDDICSVHEAILNATDNDFGGQRYDDCTAGTPGVEDFVELAANGTYLFINTIIPLDDVTINGNGATLDHINATFFDTRAGDHLRMRDMTIKGSDGGSAIEAEGSLSLQNVTMQENIGNSRGGGAIFIAWLGGEILDIRNSTFENNVTTSSGGAISVENVGALSTVLIKNSLFEGNGSWFGAPGVETFDGGAITINPGFDDRDLILLEIDDSTFNENEVKNQGGALELRLIDGVIRNSSFTKNFTGVDGSAGDGGAIRLGGGSSLHIEGSLFHENEGGRGGAIYNREGELSIENSTISTNTAGKGGGIALTGGGGNDELTTLTLSFVTMVNNHATDLLEGAGGLHNGGNDIGDEAIANIKNSIIYGNTNSSSDSFNCSIESDNVTSSFGYNMGSTDANDGCPFTDSTDVQTTGALNVHLVPLAANGGPTKTHSLSAASAALNAIPRDESECDPDTLDQRGFLRSSGDSNRCDIGAYELGADQVPSAITLQTIRTAPVQRLLWVDGALALLLAVSVLVRRNSRRQQG